jgi:hypothetical protein
MCTQISGTFERFRTYLFFPTMCCAMDSTSRTDIINQRKTTEPKKYNEVKRAQF